MKKQPPSFRTPLGRVRGLGSAHHGSGHWLAMRLTSLALIPLSLYVASTFMNVLAFGGYVDAVAWLQSPFAVTLLILFLLATLHHAANGLQVVIEDYVHCEAVKFASVFGIKFFAAALAVLGVLSIVKILFWSLLPHA